MTGRDRLAAVLGPDLLAAVDAYVDERMDARLRTLAAGRMAKRGQGEYLTVNEAADLLRADRQRVYDLCSAGRLTRLKDGSRTLISRAELEAHVANGRGRA